MVKRYRSRSRAAGSKRARPAVARIPFNSARRGIRSMREWKAVDSNRSTTEVSSASDVVLLNGMNQGTAINERIARIYIIKSIQLRLYSNIKTAGTPQNLRCILVFDKQANGVACAMADVLDAIGWAEMKNLENRDRFKVLMDKTWSHDQVSKATYQFQWYKQTNLRVVCNSLDAGDITDINNGSLFLMICSSNAAGVTASEYAMKCRVRFIDA